MIMQFQQMCVKATKIPYQFSFMLGKMAFIYNYRKPHIPLLFYNKHTLRFVVSPKRQFVDPICNLCSNAENKIEESDVDTGLFFGKLARTFGPRIVKMALRAKFLSIGINLYPPSSKRCMRAIDNYFSHQIINLEELAKTYKLKENETYLRKKIDYDEDFSTPQLETLPEKIALKPIESTSIVLMQSIQAVQPKNRYPELEGLNYEQILEELEKMTKLPPEELDREKYEFYNDKARSLIEIANTSNPQ
jgi:hypothetical protein